MTHHSEFSVWNNNFEKKNPPFWKSAAIFNLHDQNLSRFGPNRSNGSREQLCKTACLYHNLRFFSDIRSVPLPLRYSERKSCLLCYLKEINICCITFHFSFQCSQHGRTNFSRLRQVSIGWGEIVVRWRTEDDEHCRDERNDSPLHKRRGHQEGVPMFLLHSVPQVPRQFSHILRGTDD